MLHISNVNVIRIYCRSGSGFEWFEKVAAWSWESGSTTPREIQLDGGRTWTKTERTSGKFLHLSDKKRKTVSQKIIKSYEINEIKIKRILSYLKSTTG